VSYVEARTLAQGSSERMLKERGCHWTSRQNRYQILRNRPKQTIIALRIPDDLCKRRVRVLFVDIDDDLDVPDPPFQPVRLGKATKANFDSLNQGTRIKLWPLANQSTTTLVDHQQAVGRR